MARERAHPLDPAELAPTLEGPEPRPVTPPATDGVLPGDDSGSSTLDLSGALADAGLEARVGSKLGGRYHLQRLVGKGGMGAVYLARDEVLGKDVALKFVRRELAGGPDGLSRLRAEVQLAQRVTHRNVCRTYDLEEVDGVFLVKMEYIDGDTLARRLQERGRLSIDEALELGRAVAIGLEAAHAQGVIHCDLKPQNILIERGTRRIALMDFGIARVVARTGDTGRLGPSGTPEYMAPEQARGMKVDPRTDLYALGCVLYHVLVGEVPFPASTPLACALRHVTDPAPDPRTARPEIPGWVARVIRRLLEKDSTRRFPDAAAVLAALAGPRRFPWKRTTATALAITAVGVMAATFAHRHAASQQHADWHPSTVARVPGYEENSDQPVISPDGQWLAYPADRDGKWRLYVEPLGGGPARAVTPPSDRVMHPTWSRDGRALIAVDQQSRVMRIPIDGSLPQQLAEGAQRAIDCGGRLLLIKHGGSACPGCLRMVLRDVQGDPPLERVLVELPPGHNTHYPRCDATGSRIVYNVVQPGSVGIIPSLADLYLLSLDGGPPRRLTTDSRRNAYPVFHPDGRSIIFASERSGSMQLWEMPVDGRAEPLQLTTDGPAVAADVSPDGRTLVYNHDITTVPLYAQRLDGSPRRRILPTLEDVLQPSPTPDGREVVAVVVRQNQPLVVALPLEDGAERVLAQGESAALTLDGREVVFASNAGGKAELRALPLAGGASRVLARLPQRAGVVGISDGDVYFDMMTGNRYVSYRVPLAGGAPVQAGTEQHPRVIPAPVGGWRIAFKHPMAKEGMFEARLIAPSRPIDDPEAAKLTSRHRPHWTPDGKALLVWDGSEIRRHDIATGSDHALVPAKDVNSIALSHDGRTLFYSETLGHVRRQMITNFADRPRPL